MNIKLVCVILSSIICLLQPAIGTMNLKNIYQTDTAILNEKPIPDFLWTPEWPNISTIIHFDASNSSDPDGFITVYSWDFTNDGIPDKTGVEVTWSWNYEGQYPVRLSVCDDLLLCNGTTKDIRVLNSTPVADFTWNPEKPIINQIVTLDASDSFDPDGIIMTYYWDYDEDPDWDAVGGDEDKIVTYSWDSIGTYIITLKVEDSNFNNDIINKSLTIIQNNPPYSPYNPYPADGTTNVSTNIILGWEGGDPDAGDTVTYDIYFGSMPPFQKVSSNQSETDYNPGELFYDLTYFWNIVVWDEHGAKTIGPSWHFTTSSEEDNTPPDAPIIIGELEGKADVEYEYNFVTVDPDGDDIYYLVDWGDGNSSGWIGPQNSGESIDIIHIWTEEGYYEIRAKCKDVYGDESDWTTLEVSMPKSKNSNYQNNISIEFRGGFGLTIIIKNNGNSTIPILEFIFCLDAPWMILGGESTTTLSNIAPGSEERIITGFLFGFGRFDATVNVLDISESRSGFMIGPFVILF